MAERLTFILDGRDDLSRVLGHAGNSAIRLRDTMTDAADGSNQAILTLTRDADGRLRDLRGQFVSTGDAARLMAMRTAGTVRTMGDWAATADRTSRSTRRLTTAILSLAPAAIPIAAAMGPIATSTASAGAALIAYGLALGPQVAAMSKAAEAEKKYREAVEESGRTSKEAVEAQAAYARSVSKLPPATRQAAASLSVLKDEYKEWSASLAQDTMGPFTKGMAVFGGLLPKLTPLVRGTSAELDRMMTLLAGGMESPGFDRVMNKFAGFTTGVLRRMNDGIVRLARNLDTGKVGGGFSEFMDYARANGPLVGDTLKTIGEALTKLLIAASDTGVGMLTLINVFANLVTAIPTELISTLLQLAIALKVVKLASAGMVAAGAAMAAFRTQVVAAGTAAAASSGTFAAMGGAFMALSRTARIAVAGSGIGLLVIALAELSSAGRRTAPDVDAMTTAMGEFARTGKVTGEAARVFGADLHGLNEALQILARPSTTQSIEKWMSDLLGGLGEGGPDTREAAAAFNALDESLANLVAGGKADLAAAAVQRITTYLKGQGKTSAEIKAQLDSYNQALADAAFEQQVAAQAMGLFGQQALATKAKLDQQKLSADGLRQAIMALNDANRQGMGGMIGFEAAIDAATKAAKDNAGALTMVDGQLDLNSEKSRSAATALNDLAAKTDEAAASARESGASWSTVNGIYARGRERLIASAQAMGLTKVQAKALADQILKTPDKTARLRGNMEDLQAKLNNAKRQLKSVPDSRKAAVRAQIAQLEAAIAAARRKLAGIDGTVANTYIYTNHIVTRSTGEARKRKGGPGHYAKGGLVGFPTGGPVRGPGTTTSDSILAMLSNGEYVIPAKRVVQFGVATFDAIRDGTLSKAMPAPRTMVRSTSASTGLGGDSPTQTAALVRSVVAELVAAQAPTEVRVFIGNQEISKIARAEVVRANGELVQVLNAGGGQ